LKEKTCRDFSSSDDPAIFLCVSEAALETAASETVIRACDVMQGAYKRCEQGFDRTQCIGQAKLFTDDALESAITSCENVPCEKGKDGVRKCIEASVAMAEYTSLENLESNIETADQYKSNRSSSSGGRDINVRDECLQMFVNNPGLSEVVSPRTCN